MTIKRLTLREDRDMWKRLALALASDYRQSICGVPCQSSWHEPVACAFRPHHGGDHSWASLPALPPWCGWTDTPGEKCEVCGGHGVVGDKLVPGPGPGGRVTTMVTCPKCGRQEEERP